MDTGHWVLIGTTAISSLTAFIIALVSYSQHKKISKQEQHSALQMASLDRRLQVHQDAWTEWNNLLFHLDDPVALWDASTQASEWFIANNLYLAKDARLAFYSAYIAASSLAQNRDSIQAEEADAVRVQWRRDIICAGEKIENGVALPSLSETPESYQELISAIRAAGRPAQ